MTDIKTKILIFAAAILILLSAAVPFFILFSGAKALEPPMVAAPDVPVSALAPIGEVESEMRAVWIATVNNINFPSRTGLSATALAKELDSIVKFSKENGFNTILFQVRPSSDALYDSEIYPASKFVSGECGKAADGGFDCLEYILDAAHAENIEVHAWVNPLRITTGSAAYPQTDISALPESSPAVQNPSYVVAYADGKLYFDAGYPDVRELVASGVQEICENYDADGIVFDDYFYPYPTDGKDFDDSASYAKYGSLFDDVADFRRDNINKLVELCYTTVKRVNKDIDFGVSPFGIWRNGDGENGGSLTRGLSAYDEIYCDALAWANGGYVDYLAPQLYWTFETSSAPFDVLAEWWSRALDGTGVKLYINHGVYRYDDGGMASGELIKQVEFSRELYSYRGSMYYGYAALHGNAGGVGDEVAQAFSKNIAYFEYFEGDKLTVDSYSDGDTAGSLALISGKSNLAYPISVNGITPLRYKDGTYAITLQLLKGDNLITVINGNEKIEIMLKY